MDEELKQQLMPAVLVFNMTVVVWVLYRFFTAPRGMFIGDFLMQAIIGAAIGLVTGGITLALTMRKK